VLLKYWLPLVRVQITITECVQVLKHFVLCFGVDIVQAAHSSSWLGADALVAAHANGGRSRNHDNFDSSSHDYRDSSSLGYRDSSSGGGGGGDNSKASNHSVGDGSDDSGDSESGSGNNVGGGGAAIRGWRQVKVPSSRSRRKRAHPERPVTNHVLKHVMDHAMNHAMNHALSRCRLVLLQCAANRTMMVQPTLASIANTHTAPNRCEGGCNP
jgi:hypothetical protein